MWASFSQALDWWLRVGKAPAHLNLLFHYQYQVARLSVPRFDRIDSTFSLQMPILCHAEVRASAQQDKSFDVLCSVRQMNPDIHNEVEGKSGSASLDCMLKRNKYYWHVLPNDINIDLRGLHSNWRHQIIRHLVRCSLDESKRTRWDGRSIEKSAAPQPGDLAVWSAFVG